MQSFISQIVCFMMVLLPLKTIALPSSIITPADILSVRILNEPNSTIPLLGVRLCTGAKFTGQCYRSQWPGNECIGLGGFAGHTLSFNPSKEVECFLMQGACDANKDYLDLTHNSMETGNLSAVPWIADVASYTCWNSSLI